MIDRQSGAAERRHRRHCRHRRRQRRATNVSATGQVTAPRATASWRSMARRPFCRPLPRRLRSAPAMPPTSTSMPSPSLADFFGTDTTRGGIDAIDTTSGVDQAIALNGTTENASGRMTDLAVKPTAGTTSLVNNCTLNGVVKLGNLGNQMTNSGLWLTAGRHQQFFAPAPPAATRSWRLPRHRKARRPASSA